MNYNFFKKTLKRLVELKRGQDKVNKALNEISIFPSTLFFDKHEELIVDVLQEYMNDEDDWIGYFLYEMNMEFTDENIVSDANNKNLSLRNYRDLYNLIINV